MDLNLGDAIHVTEIKIEAEGKYVLQVLLDRCPLYSLAPWAMGGYNGSWVTNRRLKWLVDVFQSREVVGVPPFIVSNCIVISSGDLRGQGGSEARVVREVEGLLMPLFWSGLLRACENDVVLSSGDGGSGVWVSSPMVGAGSVVGGTGW